MPSKVNKQNVAYIINSLSLSRITVAVPPILSPPKARIASLLVIESPATESAG